MTTLSFIDVSHHQGAVDFKKVRKSGVLGVIAKCTEGSSYFDPNYNTNRAGALDAGLAFCGYHYLHRGAAAEQIRWWIAKASFRQGERACIDYEEKDPAVTTADLHDAVMTLRAERPDLQITIYGANKLADDVNKLADVSWLTDTSLWAARYSANEPKVGKAWKIWTAWQYTDEGQVPGVDGHCDLNSFNGSPDSCLKWFGPVSTPAPAPEPELKLPTVAVCGKDIVITSEPGAPISIMWNGKQLADA